MCHFHSPGEDNWFERALFLSILSVEESEESGMYHPDRVWKELLTLPGQFQHFMTNELPCRAGRGG